MNVPMGPMILVALLLALVLVNGCGKKRTVLKTGTPAPEIQAVDLESKPLRLADYQGKVILLQFWAEACCTDVMPAIEDIYRSYRDKGFTVVAVNPVEPRDRVERAARAFGVSFPVGVDQLDISKRRYSVYGVPCAFLVDRKGIIKEKILGNIPKRNLERKVKSLLD